MAKKTLLYRPVGLKLTNLYERHDYISSSIEQGFHVIRCSEFQWKERERWRKANSYPEGKKDFISSQADELISSVINTFWTERSLIKELTDSESLWEWLSFNAFTMQNMEGGSSVSVFTYTGDIFMSHKAQQCWDPGYNPPLFMKRPWKLRCR